MFSRNSWAVADNYRSLILTAKLTLFGLSLQYCLTVLKFHKKLTIIIATMIVIIMITITITITITIIMQAF